jgi:hypothetical protein
MQYQKTLQISYVGEFPSLRIGQWFQFTETAQRGQYLGKTRFGTIVVRWQQRRVFRKPDARGNKQLRAFAKTNGSF